MERKISVVLIGLIVCMVTSCQPMENNIDITLNSRNLKVESNMSYDEFLQNCANVKNLVGSKTRAERLTENDAREIMMPFISDGIQIRNQIIEQIDDEYSLKEELVYFENLSEEECATLSFIIHSIEDGSFDGEQYNTNAISSGQILHCLGVAVGYDFMKKLSVNGIVSAVTVRQAIIAIGKRYLGYVGVVLMVVDFVGCIG